MKKIKFLTLAALLLGSLTIFYSSCIEKDEDDIVEKQVTLIADKTNVSPFELVTITADDYTFTNTEYNATIETKDIKLVKDEENNLVFMMPSIPGGSQTLSLMLDETEYQIEFNINALPVVENPTEVINTYKQNLYDALDTINYVNTLQGAQISSENIQLIETYLSDFEQALSSASQGEKQELAQFMQRNPEMFNYSNFEFYSINDSLYTGTKSTTEWDKLITRDSRRFVALVITTGVTIYVVQGSLMSANPLIAIGAGVALAVEFVMVLNQAEQTIHSSYKPFVLSVFSDDLKSTKSSLTFNNNEAVQINIEAEYRSLYNADKGKGTSSSVDDLASAMSTFLGYWNKAISYIPGMNGTVPTLEEQTSYTTNPNKSSVSSEYITIDNISNENVTIDDFSNNNDAVSVTFTTSETEDQDFTFDLIYTNPDFSVETTNIDANLTMSCNIKDLDAWWDGLDDESKIVYNYILEKGAITNKPSLQEMTSFCNMTRVNIENLGFTQFNGLEIFTNLNRLDIYSENLFTSLDVSACTELSILNCSGIPLTSLNVTGCTKLSILNCTNSPLTSLDLAGLTSLTSFNCHNSQLTSIDVSGCTALKEMIFFGNPLTDLNISGSGFEKIEYDSYNDAISDLISVNASECKALTSISVPYNSITSLDVSGCTALRVLNLHLNQLTNIDVSECTALTSLICSGNQLTSLNLINNMALTNLDCSVNQLTSLNISGHTALTKLDLRGNPLTSLSVSGCIELKELDFDFYNSPITSLNISGTSLESINIHSSYSGTSGGTLKSLDASGCLALSEIDVPGNSITSLDVSGCTALTNLRCGVNQLTSLDVSNNTALTNLYCDENQLTSLNASNTQILELDKYNIGGNPLENLNVSNCTELVILKSTTGSLSSLDVSGCTALTELDCYYNQLTNLDVSGCTALTELECYSNQLTNLDVSEFTALTRLSCRSNNLTSLNVNGLSNLTYAQISSNQFGYNALDGIIRQLAPLISFSWTCDNAANDNGPDPEHPYTDSDCDKLNDLYDSLRNK